MSDEPAWCEVYGRGSGQRVPGLHHAHTERPYGQMTTYCGVVVSSVFPQTRPSQVDVGSAASALTISLCTLSNVCINGPE